jgi:hypothetical protein
VRNVPLITRSTTPPSLGSRIDTAATELAGMNRERWRRRAQRASDAFGLVLALVLLTYVLASLISNRGWPAVLLTVVTSATSVVALTSSHARPVFVRRALMLALLAILLAMVAAVTGGRPWLNAASLIEIGLLAVAMAAVLRRVVTSDNVSSRTILGAISVYIALGILFTWAYSLIDRIEGGGFFGAAANVTGSDFLFFSYTTLTTTGYGDLVPAGQVGRMVSGLEMMLGQIFLVTLVAGLVSLWRPGEGILRRRERRGGETPPADAPSGG